MMKTSKEFRNFTAGIKTAMSTFSITGIKVDISLLESELGSKRAGNVFRLVGSNLRWANCGTRETMLTHVMQTRKLRAALRRQRYRNLDKKTDATRIHHTECDS
ncbi:hypothetical protein [Vibrio sp. 10N.222.55.B11]|uniref:hypothetical protein n=1 Tax=Vibrio sp. 10N.222.55.B11 TaxID=3229648 RepID=UPI0035500363